MGDIYQFSLNANVYAGPGGYASMKIDPQIFIDPSFPDAADYTLEFSAFTQSTPEPSTTSLLSAGFARSAGSRNVQEAPCETRLMILTIRAVLSPPRCRFG